MLEVEILSKDEPCIKKIQKDIKSVFSTICIKPTIRTINTQNVALYTKDQYLCVFIDFDADGAAELARALNSIENHAEIIILSNDLHDSYKINDIDLRAFIYKGNMDGYIRDALNGLRNKISQSDSDYIKVRWRNTYHVVPKSDIIYIERERRKVFVHMPNKEYYKTYMKLDEIYELLGDDFLRVHFSYIINKNHVLQYNRDHVILDNGRFISISRKYAQEVKDYFEENEE